MLRLLCKIGLHFMIENGSERVCYSMISYEWDVTPPVRACLGCGKVQERNYRMLYKGSYSRSPIIKWGRWVDVEEQQ